VRNFDAVSASLARELPHLSAEMQRALDQVSTVVSENRGDVSASMENIRRITTNLQGSVDNLNKITGQIAGGKGTIGKLVNSEEAYNGVVSTLDSIKGGVETLSGTIGAASKFKIDVNLEGYYLSHPESSFGYKSHSTFGLMIDPQDGKRLYRAGFVSVPNGILTQQSQRYTVTNPDGTTSATTIETLQRQNRYTFDALFGYRAPYDVRVWGGLIESRAGVAVDYPFTLRDRAATLSFQAFDFAREDNKRAHLRLTGTWQLHPNIYVVTGYDDFIQKGSPFIGAGIRWHDDNLKYLLTALPKF
nr:hypothetical protein [Acidobacteriota bacterium]